MDNKQQHTTEGFRHHTDVQIRFNDIDILGHVNNTVYFSFYDTAAREQPRDSPIIER